MAYVVQNSNKPGMENEVAGNCTLSRDLDDKSE